jgi:hypothetical protein
MRKEATIRAASRRTGLYLNPAPLFILLLFLVSFGQHKSGAGLNVEIYDLLAVEI